MVGLNDYFSIRFLDMSIMHDHGVAIIAVFLLALITFIILTENRRRSDDFENGKPKHKH